MTAAVREYLPANARRSQILHSARSVFAARGYRAVTTGEIALAAGVSWSLIAHYFGDKRGLYRAVLASIADSAVPFTVPDGTLQVRLAAAVDHGLRTIEHNRESWWAAIGGWDGNHDVEVSEIIDRGRRRMAAITIEAFGQDAPTLGAADLAAVSLSALSFAETAATGWTRHREHSREALIAFITQATMAIFAAAAATLAGQETVDVGNH